MTIARDHSPLVFTHRALPQRVRFGTGHAARNVASEISDAGALRVMLIASEAKLAMARTVTGSVEPALIWTDVVQHVPAAVAEAARVEAVRAGVDLIVSVGGGSTTGLAKAIALTTGIPIVAVPTTYAGSEATNVWGLTEGARKTTGVDDRVLPGAVVYDAELTLSLPVELSVTSGLNGVAHCVDSLWAPRADPINAALAAEGIRALATGLRGVVADPGGLAGREQAQFGAYLAAVAFASAGSGLHHKICHVLGGTYDLPHAQTHAIVLPYVTAFNVGAAPAAERAIARALDASDAVEGLDALRDDVGAPSALRDLGFDPDRIREAAEIILPQVPASNPRPVDLDSLQLLLGAAADGRSSETLRGR
ncbi:maleylacetate reductase [Microbacterium allomyrinae]|uniref:Maleylacetate reductase n=1 Tax=Microbacterium allomyrinae TaxID=2830666 RepID=A0A9X1LXI5_9MICO|nr:maleylacetate reductase [Microbacterium allomyrinae]MCC2033185.1 maleylacetate reductase [Microbacterium allomyrinae]